ncbi:hypothetical protein PAAL109150_09750 [Paenibacillus alkaliterrae]
MPAGIQPQVQIQTPDGGFLGLDTASEPTSLSLARSRRLHNIYQGKLRALTQRPGSVPVINPALGAAIKHLTQYPFKQSVSVGAAPTLSAVGDAASTLPSGTYYVRYTYVTDNGETEASAEVNVVVPPAVDNPTAAPSLTTATSGGSLPAATYFVVYTWVNSVGETQVSPEASIITSGSTSTITATMPTFPSGVTSVNVYISTSTGTQTRQGSTTTTSYTQSAALVSGAAKPASNTCIVAKLRVTVPAVPFHANKTRIYISTTTNTETLQGETTTTTFDRSTPLVSGAAYPTANTTSFRGELLATSSTSLYSFYNGKLNAATMTNALNSADIYDADFTNKALTNRKIIADGGSLKSYDGSAVANITPAANDGGSNPNNVLPDINAKGCKYVWTHNNYIFISPGTAELFYSKKDEFDYFPQTFYGLLNRLGDYVNGPGVSFDNVCFVPLRRGWNIISGTDSTNFTFQEYLNTINGVIAPRSIVGKITYPDGRQTIPYLSDDGVHEIVNVAVDSKSRYYGTRSLMKDKVDWAAYGFTEAEMTAAVAEYIVQWNMYLLQIKRGATQYVFGYDTRNEEWYGPWTGLTINSLIEWQGVVYFGGDDGRLKKFDATLNSDWTDMAKTVGTPVDYDRISGMIWFEDTGYPSMLDYYILRLKQYSLKASLDISIIHMRGTVEVQEALKNVYLVWDAGQWDNTAWANLDYTDLVSAPQRLSNKLKLPRQGFYFQIRLRNNRDEPVEIFGETLIGRTSGE